MIRDEIRKLISGVVRKKFGDTSIHDFSVAPPEQAVHGDYATNVAMALARIAKKSPMEIARDIAEDLQKEKYFKKVECVTPGFINIWISDEVLEMEFDGILKKQDDYGKGEKKKEKIQIEFISANPTGPLTLANGRGGFLGDALARVLIHQGYEIEKEYYVNDAGNQVLMLGNAVLASVGKIPDSEDYYHGEHIQEWANSHRAVLDANEKDPEYIGRQVAQDFLETMIKPSIESKMGIHFDRFTSEAENIRGGKYLEKFEVVAKDYIYEDDGARWLKTEQFGDDKNRVLVTSDSFPTYFYADAGHYLETKERGFDLKINILGADHHGYVSRIQAVANIVGLKSKIIVMQLVRLMSEGKEVRMSKRRGMFITIDELIDEVGVDAARYFFLEKSPDTHVTFDLELAKKKTAENPVYYVQYAHARCESIVEKIKNQDEGLLTNRGDMHLLREAEEQKLIKKLIQFPEMVADTAGDYQVSRLTRYALDLAYTFHGFYEKHRVMTDDAARTAARVLLVQSFQAVLANTLGLLGISAPKKM